MKKTVFQSFFIAGIVACGTFPFSEFAVADTLSLSVNSGISVSDTIENPLFIASSPAVRLKFGEPPDMKTVAGQIKLFRVTAGGDQEVACLTVLDKEDPTVLLLFKKNETDLSEAEEYKITIGDNVKSWRGRPIGKGYTGYFFHHFSHYSL